MSETDGWIRKPFRPRRPIFPVWLYVLAGGVIVGVRWLIEALQ